MLNPVAIRLSYHHFWVSHELYKVIRLSIYSQGYASSMLERRLEYLLSFVKVKHNSCSRPSGRPHTPNTSTKNPIDVGKVSVL